MRKIISFLFLGGLFFSCNKQKEAVPNPPAPLPEINKTYGGSDQDYGACVSGTLDGGYVLVGSTFSNDGDVSNNRGYGDAWIVKLNKEGNMLWQKTFGGAVHDAVQSVINCLDSGYLVAGSTSSSDGDVSGNHGNVDAWVVKLDKQGNLVWQKTLGGFNWDEANAVVASTDGGYVVACSTKSTDGDIRDNHGYWDIWLVKLDNEGNIAWQKTIGGSNYDAARAIINSSDGGYVVAGSTLSSDGDITSWKGGTDAWVVKLDGEGSIEWEKTYGGSGLDYGVSIVKTIDNGYVMAAYTSSTDIDVSGYHGGQDAWVVKLDSNGNLIWQKTLGGSELDEPGSITTSLDGGYVLVGYTRSNDGDVSGFHGGFSDAWIVKLDKNGSIVWQKAMGGSSDDYATSILPRTDGSYLMAGNTMSNDGDISKNRGGHDAWVITIKDQ